jgi:hypothetical protein
VLGFCSINQENAMNGEVAPKEMKPGTIVLQYLDDSRCFLGMVAHTSKVACLSRDSKKYYERFLNDPTLPNEKGQVCLVLLWNGFRRFDEYFDPPLTKPFPWYEAGRIRVAEKVDLSPEFNLMKLHEASQSTGLFEGMSLRRDLFGFSRRQIRALQLAHLIGWHVGGRVGGVAEQLVVAHMNHDEKVVAFLKELETAAPLE